MTAQIKNIIFIKANTTKHKIFKDCEYWYYYDITDEDLNNLIEEIRPLIEFVFPQISIPKLSIDYTLTGIINKLWNALRYHDSLFTDESIKFSYSIDDDSRNESIRISKNTYSDLKKSVLCAYGIEIKFSPYTNQFIISVFYRKNVTSDNNDTNIFIEMTHKDKFNSTSSINGLKEFINKTYRDKRYIQFQFTID